MSNDKLWIYDIQQLFNSSQIIPREEQTLTQKLNTIVRLTVLIILIMACWDSRFALIVLFMVCTSTVVAHSVAVADQSKDRFEGFEDNQCSTGACSLSSDKHDIRSPQVKNQYKTFLQNTSGADAHLSDFMREYRTYTTETYNPRFPLSQKRFCNDEEPLVFDCSFKSANQSMAGAANPKTTSAPILAPRSHDLDVWKVNDFVVHSHINDSTNFDQARAGYNYGLLPTKCKSCFKQPCSCSSDPLTSLDSLVLSSTDDEIRRINPYFDALQKRCQQTCDPSLSYGLQTPYNLKAPTTTIPNVKGCCFQEDRLRYRQNKQFPEASCDPCNSQTLKNPTFMFQPKVIATTPGGCGSNNNTFKNHWAKTGSLAYTGVKEMYEDVKFGAANDGLLSLQQPQSQQQQQQSNMFDMIQELVYEMKEKGGDIEDLSLLRAYIRNSFLSKNMGLLRDREIDHAIRTINTLNGACLESPQHDNLLTNTIMPGVYQKTHIGEPIQSNIGITYTQDWGPVEVEQCPWGIKYTEQDPCSVTVTDTTESREIKQDVSNVYDPRLTGYGTSYRGYTDALTGQPKFFYKDIDAVTKPNYITRHKLDVFNWAPTYGPDKDIPDLDEHRQLANNTFAESAISFRTEMMERLMRKKNAEQWQRRVMPISTMNRTSGWRSAV